MKKINLKTILNKKQIYRTIFYRTSQTGGILIPIFLFDIGNRKTLFRSQWIRIFNYVETTPENFKIIKHLIIYTFIRNFDI